ncbi:TetR/AcrR family transcriptional regulator [Streptomyces sp. NBC_00059]|uniref:TetR/AcrR family transcriptional regulator n=1 Tax=Streptomyces sp. NBC_00059 TaxID=2975635 RepID=UPI002255DB57|nr:TetR/AcrR family transcriptional regulator [Streptomyces sp. NBC_00059]MCX5416145.1 TetR/AcrR family transcriptional regulator [Streptomyces sp. NBC_00059]
MGSAEKPIDSRFGRDGSRLHLASEGTLPEVTDKRLLRGARTRGTVLRRAVDIASLEGLGGVSFGRLAVDTGLSKAGIQTLFKTKETLQLATVEFAREMFIDAVIRPARTAPSGIARLRALLDCWVVYAETPLFAGGCFRVANLAEFDSRPGPVHDALFHDQREWREALATELRKAVNSGEIAGLDVELTVFQMDALLCAANTALQSGDSEAVGKARLIIDGLLATPR